MRAWYPLLALAALLCVAMPAASERVWDVSDATVTLQLDESHWSNLGFTIVHSRTSAALGGRVIEAMPGATHAFRAETTSELRFTSQNGRMTGFTSERVEIPFSGGLAIQTRHPATGRPLAPKFLYDFVLVIDRSLERDPISIHVPGEADPVFRVRNAGFHLDEQTNELSVRMGDLQVSEAWATALEQPYLTDQWAGMIDVRFPASTLDPRDIVEVPESARGDDPGSTPSLDVTLGQLYGIVSQGHIGSYPNGRAGLSAATTSCNTGTVIVPWNGPMAETHPFIQLALFRLSADGIMEQLGTNWAKHGFYALSNDQCDLGCSASNGSYLGIGCSDTYSSGHNGDRYHLGPRSEINPYTGEWEACGSFFDEPDGIPDGGCSRSYFGAAANSVEHRVDVADADLDNPGASYFYEGNYVVAGDTRPANSIAWRECTMSWSGSNWSFQTVGGGSQTTPTYGTLIESWGDLAKGQKVGSDDGEAVIAVQVTDNGDGTWHYEYAVYNWRSARGVRHFSVPVYTAGAITNVGFHDPDADGSNDWVGSIQGANMVWEVEDYDTNPDAHVIDDGEMFNFRFDADVPAVMSEATGGAFRPGVGEFFTVSMTAPSAPPTTATPQLPAANDGLMLATNEPNPFSSATRISFSLPSEQPVRLTVHDVTGRMVRTLVDRMAPAGASQTRWDGRDSAGREVASGVYFFRLQTDSGERSVKATLRR